MSAVDLLGCCCSELGTLSQRPGDICSNCERRLAEPCYPTDERGQQDAGDDRETRVPPCTLRTWCIRADGHIGPCHEVPRWKHERQDWDLRTPDPTGWNAQKRSREGG